MLILVTYDVNTACPEGQRRLRQIAKVCENKGQRVQYSVFECDLEPAQWVKMKEKLLTLFDPQKDSLRFYFLGSNWERKIEHHGAKESYHPTQDTLMF